MTYAGIDLAAGKLVYINAGGMPPLLMVGPGRLLTLDQPSLVLGVDKDYAYEPTRVDLPETFRVVFHTDGLTDAMDAGNKDFGRERLKEVLRLNANASVQSMGDALFDAVRLHQGTADAFDDQLLRGGPEGKQPAVVQVNGSINTDSRRRAVCADRRFVRPVVVLQELERYQTA